MKEILKSIALLASIIIGLAVLLYFRYLIWQKIHPDAPWWGFLL